MKQNFSLIAIAIMLTFFISCNESKKNGNKNVENGKTEQIEHKALEKDNDHIQWSYEKGKYGPENWENLGDGFADCGGNTQSPIDIITKNVINEKNLLKPQFNYGKSKVDIINNGHTILFNIDGDNNIKLNGKNYKLLQFHYHALSEHTIDGKHSPIEVHFVHKYSDTDFAVIGVMYVEGKENELFKKYLDKFPMDKGEFKSEDMIDLLKILPNNKSYYFYNGSLTTPPCSEVVNWYILKNPIEASKEQIENFSKILHENYRPIQALNGRKIKQYLE